MTLAALVACSGDDGPPGNGSADASTVDPATAHELVDCDRASYDPVVQLPAGTRCERACMVRPEASGPSCATNCASVTSCPTTSSYGGLVGCCVFDSGPFVMTYCECE
jgi:hypothetical protein